MLLAPVGHDKCKPQKYHSEQCCYGVLIIISKSNILKFIPADVKHGLFAASDGI